MELIADSSGKKGTTPQFYQSFKGDSSNTLKDAGIPGIRYLDQGSRGAGQGSYNYVVFDDSIPKIVKRNGKPIK